MKDDDEMKLELRLRFDTIYEVQIMSNKVGESMTRICFIVRLRLMKTQNLFTQTQLCREGWGFRMDGRESAASETEDVGWFGAKNDVLTYRDLPQDREE